VLLPIGDAGPKELSLIEHDIRPAAPFIIGTAQDATQTLILGALRAGIPEFVAAPLNAEELDIAVRRLVRRMEPGLRTRGKILAVYSAKGGLGTTTAAVNLATALAREHTAERVALVDFVVVGGDVRVVLDLKPAYDIGDLVMKVDRIDGELLSSLMTPGPGGMLVLPSSDRPEVQDLIEANAVSAILSQLRAHFNYVVLDLDHYLGERTIGALDAADHIVLVTQLSVAALRSTQRTLNLFNRLGYAPAKVAVVMNRSNADSPLTISDAETVLGRPVTAKLPNDFSACADATTKGVPVLEYEPDSALSNGFRKLATAFATPPELEAAATRGHASGNGNGNGETEPRMRRLFRLGRS
jgi:pilus assembly protein CpaE